MKDYFFYYKFYYGRLRGGFYSEFFYCHIQNFNDIRISSIIMNDMN